MMMYYNMDTNESTTRPIIPTVQIDMWGKKAGAKLYTVDALARAMMQDHERLVCWTLLKAYRATTVQKIAACIQMARQPPEPRVGNGQVYLQVNWRIRWEDMCPAVHDMVLNLKAHSPQELRKAFHAHYDIESVVTCIYTIIGPARAAGARAALLRCTVWTGE